MTPFIESVSVGGCSVSVMLVAVLIAREKIGEAEGALSAV